MEKLNKHDVVVQAVDLMKKSEFKATAIKLEFEAQLNRGSEDSQYCNECDGDYEGSYCGNCDGDGNIVCDCDNIGCDDTTECDTCDGTGRVDACTSCHEGYVYPNGGNFDSVSFCHDWIMEKLSGLGLAEQANPERTLSHGQSTNWRPVAPLVYAEFYNDGSVDSELTFTISLKDSENIFLLPKVLEIFKELAAQVDNGFDTSGAGLHMALINSEDCRYPSTDGMNGQRDAYHQYRQSMSLLLPALFFLGSCNENSRALRFRAPRVDSEEKYSAIFWNDSALEFRVFDTCYDSPETLFDNVVVMANTLKYWRKYGAKTPLTTVTRRVAFGKDDSNKLERFYLCNEHIDLLNKGLQILKPSYITVAELKKQRKFKVTKRTINNRFKKAEADARLEYTEYNSRYEWRIVMERSRIIARDAENYAYGGSLVPDMAELEKRANEHAEEVAKQKLPLAKYVQQKVDMLKNDNVGNYRLGVS